MTHIWVHNPFPCPPSCHLLYQMVLISVWILIPHVSGGTRSVWPFFFLHGRRPLGPHQYLLKAGISIDKCLETTPATTENRIEWNGMERSGATWAYGGDIRSAWLWRPISKSRSPIRGAKPQRRTIHLMALLHSVGRWGLPGALNLVAYVITKLSGRGDKINVAMASAIGCPRNG